MARRALVLALAFAAMASSGCLSYETSHSHESPDSCWMFCGDTTYSYEAFIWFPMMIVLLLVVGIVVAVVAASSNNQPQQQVVIKQDEKD